MKPQAIACSFVTTPVPLIRFWTIRFFVRRVFTSPMCVVTLLHERPAPLDEVVGHVEGEPADARVARREPRPAARLEEGVDLFPGLVRVPERRQAAEVDQVRPDADHVVHDPGELRQDDADRLRPGRDLDPEHLLDGAGVPVAVDHRGAVVQAVRVGDHLRVRVRLRHLLEAAVQVPALALGRHDPLAVDAQDDPERAVRRGVRRPEVERHRLEDVLREIGLRGESGLEDVLVGAEPALPRLVVLAQGVPDEAVVRQETGEVRVPVEPDPHQVPGLALEPVRRGPDLRQGREARVGRRESDAQAQVLVALRRVEEGVQLEPLVPAEGGRAVELQPVDRDEVEEEVVRRRRVVAQEARRLEKGLGGRDDGRYVRGGAPLHVDRAVGELPFEDRGEGDAARRGEGRAHALSPFAASAASASADSAISGNSCPWARPGAMTDFEYAGIDSTCGSVPTRIGT